MRDGNTRTHEKHQAAPAPPVNGRQGYKGKRHVHQSRNYDEKQNRIHAEASTLENIFGIVEQYVDPTPLLQDGQPATDTQDLDQFRRKQLSHANSCNFFSGHGSLNASNLLLSVGLVADAFQHTSGLSFLTIFDQPSRALWNKKRRTKKQQ